MCNTFWKRPPFSIFTDAYKKRKLKKFMKKSVKHENKWLCQRCNLISWLFVLDIFSWLLTGPSAPAAAATPWRDNMNFNVVVDAIVLLAKFHRVVFGRQTGENIWLQGGTARRQARFSKGWSQKISRIKANKLWLRIE